MEELTSALLQAANAYTDHTTAFLLIFCGLAILFSVTCYVMNKEEEHRDAKWADRIAEALKVHDSNK